MRLDWYRDPFVFFVASCEIEGLRGIRTLVKKGTQDLHLYASVSLW